MQRHLSYQDIFLTLHYFLVLLFDKKIVIGDPTEAALIVSAAKAGINQDMLQKKYPRKDEITFIPNGIDFEKISNSNIKSKEFDQVYMGRL